MSAGLSAEVAHIQFLDVPHNSPEIAINLLCWCLNHPVMFDNGGFSIAKGLCLIGMSG